MQWVATFKGLFVLMIIYCAGFYLPFLISIFTEDPRVSRPFLVVGFLVQLAFFVIEITQIMHQKMAYFSSFWNIFDFMQFFLYTKFMMDFFEMLDTEFEYIGFNLKIMQLSIIICGFIKILYFIRIFEQFGFLVQMVAKTCIKVVPFMFFFTLWVLFFTFCYKTMDVVVKGKDEEYPFVNNFMVLIIQVYRNSIGDIATPGYSDLSDFISQTE